MNVSIAKNIRSIFLSFVITFGIGILYFIYEYNPIENFFLCVFLLYVVFLTELYSVYFWAKRQMSQLNIPIVNRYSKLVQIVHHTVLPSISYFAFAGFVYFNPNPIIWPFVLLLVFVSYFLLFTNLRAYYEDKFKLEQSTHLVYDFLKLIFLAIAFFDIYALALMYRLDNTTVFLMVSVSSLVATLLMLLRYNHHSPKHYLASFAISILCATVAIAVLEFDNFDIYRRVVAVFTCFYFGFGILHHTINHDLNWKILAEYLSIAAIVGVMSMSI